MSWFFITLSASFLYSIVNIFDQYLVAKYSSGKRGSGGLVLFSSLIGIIVASIIAIFTVGIFEISLLDKLLLILTGGISLLWIILYLFTLEIEDVSSVVPWFQLVPVFGYLLGFILLGETLTVKQLTGSLVILAGVVLISTDFSGKKHLFKWESALYMVIVSLLISVSGVIFKYVTIGNNYWISTFWNYAGLGIFGLLLYIFSPKLRHEFMYMNKKGGAKIFILNTSSEAITILGNLLTYYALLLAPVTLVYLVGSFQPAIVFCLAITISKHYPFILKENMNIKVILPKLFAILMMIAGSVFLFL